MEPENSPFPISPPQPTATPVSPIPPKKNNLVVILLSVLLLITLLMGGYLFLQVQGLTKQLAQSQVLVQATPIPSPAEASAEEGTANWKTYQDESVAFQYPGVWTLKETEVYGSHSINDFTYQDNIIFEFAKYANYSQETGIAYQSLDEYLKNDIGKRKDITINNNPAKLMIYSGTGLSAPSKTALFFSPDRKSIMMLHQPNLDQSKNSDNTFDQILSTFKFTQ